MSGEKEKKRRNYLGPIKVLPVKQRLTLQITNVRTESKTVRVVADNSFVTLTPAKLKNAILITVPMAINNN